MLGQLRNVVLTCMTMFILSAKQIPKLSTSNLTEWGEVVYGNSLSAAAAAAKLLQSFPTLCDPRDGSPPGSPVPGILQARILEWVAISFFSA